MKHLLLILISFLLLSSPVFGNSHKGETFYEWKTVSGIQWREIGDKDIHAKYKGDVVIGKPHGVGTVVYPDGNKYVGEWKDGKRWNGITYDKDGNIQYKYVNGKGTKQ